MGNRHVKTCLILLIIREMQIKSTMRYHRQNGHHQKSTNKTCWRKHGEGGLPRAVGGNMNWCNNHYGEEYGDPTKTRVPCDPAVVLLGIYTEETKIKRHMHRSVHCSRAYNSRSMETTEVPRDRREEEAEVLHAQQDTTQRKNGVKRRRPQQQGWT